MKLDSINVSLASFQISNVELIYLDPYNNTLGENNWIIICLAIISCICSICAIYLSFGVVMFEKHGLNPENRKLLDMLISFVMGASIILVIPTTCLMVQRNVFGPFQNENIVVGLVSVQAFGRITVIMVTIEAYFVWYMTEKVFKGQCEMDAVGMAECISFFTVSLSPPLL